MSNHFVLFIEAELQPVHRLLILLTEEDPRRLEARNLM